MEINMALHLYTGILRATAHIIRSRNRIVCACEIKDNKQPFASEMGETRLAN
jgi:hypothetical protein